MAAISELMTHFRSAIEAQLPKIQSILDSYPYPPWTLGLITLLVAVLLWKIIGSGGDSKRAYKLPTGRSTFPLIGENIAFFRAINNPQNPRKFVDEHESRFGPVFKCNLFGRSENVVTVDPEFNKYVLQNEGRLFHTAYLKSMRTIIGPYSVLSVRGELQRRLHNTIIKFFSADKLINSDAIASIQSSFATDMKKWEDKPQMHIQEEIHKAVLNLMAKKLLDLNAETDMKEINRLRNLDHFGDAIIAVPLEVPGFAFAKGVKARKLLIEKIHECIKERKENPDVVRSDMLTHLVREAVFEDEIIADLILSLFFASYETSSKALTFAVKFLMDNPRAIERMRVEHDAIAKAKGGEKLNWDDYVSMNFTHSVIKETLRLGNVAPGVFREVAQDVKTKDFEIPKGWTVYVFLNATHLDKKNFPEPLKFNPWRWEHEPGLEYSKDPWYLPFGGGARFCPGYHFAKVELAMFLHCFVTKFRCEPTEEDQIHYFPYTYMVKGLPVRLSLRE